MLSKSPSNPEAQIVTTGINKLISHRQNVLIIMISILINKDVFEPSYNYLKFMVRIHNYVCTKLIN